MEFRKRTDGIGMLDIFDSDTFNEDSEDMPMPILTLTDEEASRLVCEVLRGPMGCPGPAGMSIGTREA